MNPYHNINTVYKYSDSHEFALYKGEEILYIGTINEIAEHLGMKATTVKYYGRKSYIQRRERQGSKNYKILISLD